MNKKTSIEFTQGQLDDLYLALDFALYVMRVEGDGGEKQRVLIDFKTRVLLESMKLDGIGL